MPLIIENLARDERVYVYLICGMGRENEPLQPLKVGITGNVPGRLASVQTGSPRRLVVLAAFETPNREMARKFEANFHKNLSHRRLEGEWFDADPLFVLDLMCAQIRRYFTAAADRFSRPGDPTADDIIDMIGIPYFERESKCLRCWREYYAENSNVRAIA